MPEIISLIACLLVGLIVGWRARELYAQVVVNKYLKALETSPKQDDAISISIHKESNQYYVTMTETGQFLVQVTSKNELFDYINKSFSDKIVFIKPDQLALFDA